MPKMKSAALARIEAVTPQRSWRILEWMDLVVACFGEGWREEYERRAGKSS